MANVKITELTNLTDPSTTDVMPVVDVDADVTKKVSVGEVVGKITGDVEVATDGTATISELPVSKLQDGAARQLLQTAANGTDVEWTDDVDLPGTLDVTGVTTLDDALNVAGLASLDGGIDVDGVFTVADATGNVSTSGTLGVTGQSTLASAAISDLTEDRVVIAGASGELEDSANLTFDGSELGITGTLDVSSNGTIGGDLTVVGDLTVEGATTTLETQTVTVEDKNIELGVVDTPTDTTANGGGITLKGATDKTINWVNATDAWTSSEHIELASGKEFYIDGNGVLNATTLGSGVVNSSLTSVGTIATGTWEGTAIDAAYLDSTVVTTSDTGTVTSTMISDGTIVDGDINASAAIAGTKIDPDFGSQTVETTGVFSAAGGAAATPSIAFTGDLDTGIYSPGADQVAISTNGTERLFIDANGKLGLGTSSPQATLSVLNSAAFGAQIKISDQSQSTGTLGLGDGLNSAVNVGIWRGGANSYSTGGNFLNLGGYDGISFATGNAAIGSQTPAMTITSAQRVGIGTTSPSSLLHLADAGDITVGTTTGTKIGTATSQKIGFYNATPVVQPTAVADITTTATSGSLPTPDGSITIADAATPTVTELLEYCVELEAKLESALAALRTLGLIAT